MPIRRLDKGNYHSVGMVIATDNSNDEEEEIIYCSTCAAVGELVRLKERLYLDSNGKRLPDPPDADSYRQCWECGNVVPLREVMQQGKIAGIQGIELVNNPYERKDVILGIESKNRYRRLKQRKNKHPDPEVQRFLDQGYELKAYENYTPEPVNK